MCILTEPEFYPKDEYNEKAAVNFLVDDTSSLHNSFGDIAQKHFQGNENEKLGEDVSYEVQVCVYEDMSYDMIIHYYSSETDTNYHEKISLEELDVVQINDMRDAINKESLNIRKEFDSYNLASQVEQFAFERGEYDYPAEDRIWFIAANLKNGETVSDSVRSNVTVALEKAIKDEFIFLKLKEDIGSVIEYLEHDLNVNTDNELCEKCEDLIAKLYKFDEVYNSLDKKDKDIERE